MDSSQVPWQDGVAYEELVKQCPYLAQRRGLSLESQLTGDHPVHEVTLSKSKKKRLKRRLKTLSSVCKPAISDESSISENKPKQETHNIIKSSDLTSFLNESLSLKMEKKEQPQHMVKQKKVADVVDGEILVPDTKIGREQVLSEREARKKSKQAAKQKKGGLLAPEEVPFKLENKNNVCIVSNHSKDNILKPVKNDPKIDTVKKEIKHIVVHKADSQNVESVECDEAIKTSNSKDMFGISSNKSQNTQEKTREEVLAEREAKKKAKQLSKGKKEKDSSTELKSQPERVKQSYDSKNDVKIQEFDPKNLNNFKDVKGQVLPECDKASSGKSKAELRAERRAKQEAQRAAKEAEKKLKTETVENKENKVALASVKKQPSIEKQTVKDTKLPVKTKIVSQPRIKLFSHLHFGEKPALTQIIQTVHPSVIELGVKYSARIINGSNARCIALLNCLKEVINDYTTPSEKEFSRGLESKLGELTNYINQCRPMSVSMTNSLRHIKSHLTQLPNNVSDEEAKRKLFDVIDTYIREQIDVAGEAICDSVKNKIANGDVILIYSCSSLLYRILTESYRSGREFRVVVVDGGPWFEGREMLRRLVDAGLKCTYVQVSAISFIMKQATKVLLGAHALLANGSVMSRAGASIVALSAHSYNVPVLVCCETYKFCERVQTDAFVYNELGNPDDVVKGDERLENWQSLNFLSPLSIAYDITPPDLVTAVVTEIAILPCTSVPVILRVKPSDVVS